MTNPLNYNFGLITETFKEIHNQSISSNLFVHWNGTSQTLQLFLNKESYQDNQKYIGAIQYEGSNNLMKVHQP
jgi:hypothetical protein